RERDQNLRDRDPELERDLSQDLKRDDHGREMEPRVAEGGEHDRVRRAANRQRPPAGRSKRGGAHGQMVLRLECQTLLSARELARRRVSDTCRPETIRRVQLDQARRIVDYVVSVAPGAVSVFVADTHGEVVAAATMDGAAPDTRLNAQRKAYTAARSD